MIGSSFGTSWSRTYDDEPKKSTFEQWRDAFPFHAPCIFINSVCMAHGCSKTSIAWESLTLFSIFSQATVSLTLYRSPKNHVSLRPRVRHTKSKRSFPFHLTWNTYYVLVLYNFLSREKTENAESPEFVEFVELKEVLSCSIQNPPTKLKTQWNFSLLELNIDRKTHIICWLPLMCMNWQENKSTYLYNVKYWKPFIRCCLLNPDILAFSS